MAWIEEESGGFVARYDEADTPEVRGVLDQLQATRDRLRDVFPAVPEEVTVVVHGSQAQLDAAQPFLPLVRRRVAPSARRFVAGWADLDVIHVLAPHVLEDRATGAAGTREMLLLSPAAFYVQLILGASNPRLPPPWGPRSAARAGRWAWLIAGTAQWFSGQTALARPAIARMLREGAKPSFPPGLSHAIPMGGTVIDLLVREEGEAAAVALACNPDLKDPKSALERAFHGRSLVHTGGTWRHHMARMAGTEQPRRRRG